MIDDQKLSDGHDEENELPYSMASSKSMMFNSYFTKRIVNVSRFRPHQYLIRKIIKELYGWQLKLPSQYFLKNN